MTSDRLNLGLPLHAAAWVLCSTPLWVHNATFLPAVSKHTALLLSFVLLTIYKTVYLMYTLRPIASWQYFSHASMLCRMYLRTARGIQGDYAESSMTLPEHLRPYDQKAKRMEQSLYWSCFKSECEFRVELPLPQSELSVGEYPDLFPSPPSPVGHGHTHTRSPDTLDNGSASNGETTRIEHSDSQPPILEEDYAIRRHAKRLCKEEESWYYYLTEIALRRIGNRIINSFFLQDRSSWLDIKPFLRMAQEFEAQILTWSAHLPLAMQHYETTSMIRAPHLNSMSEDASSHVSRELSWAIDNRLLEMRTWLYQPFLYYLIHVGLGLEPPTPGGDSNHTEAVLDQPIRGSGIHSLLNPFSPQEQATGDSPVDSNVRQVPRTKMSSLNQEDFATLRSLIVAGIECNMKTLEVRSRRHRHHGLWFDLRSIMCSSLILLALVKSGNASWIPGGPEVLWGSFPEADRWADGTVPIGGRIGLVLEELSFWGAEAPDLARCRETLEGVVRDIRGS